MKDLTLKELVDLVISEVPDSYERLEKMFEWHFERDMSVVKWSLGAGASVSVAVFATLIKGELIMNVWQASAVAASALASFTYGVYRLRQLRNIHRQFVAALKLHSQLVQIRPFLKTYRDAVR